MKKVYKVVSITSTYKGFTHCVLKSYARLSSAEKYLNSLQDSITENRWYQIVECENE